jgi:hypothetical protein
MRVFKHPDEDEAPGAALMFICPLCRAPCVTAQHFEDLAKNGKCDVKERMGVTNTRELSVRKYCGDECDCVTVDIHLTHLSCGEGCYTCFASTIEYRLEMSATSPDLLRRAATTIQTTVRKMLAAKQCMIKFIVKRLDGGVLSTECWTTHQLRDLLVRMENIRGDTEAPHQAVDDCPHCTDVSGRHCTCYACVTRPARGQDKTVNCTFREAGLCTKHGRGVWSRGWLGGAL